MQTNLLYAMGSAWLGGLILNFMPCVLPVLILKINSLRKLYQTAQKIPMILCYALGVHFMFFLLSLLPFMVKFAGYAMGWGMHMQSPLIIFFLIVTVFMVALNLSDVYLLRLPVMTVQVEQRVHFFWSNCGSGMLAVLLSAPCTAPFMSAALAFAFTQSLSIGILIMQILAAGFVFPLAAVVAMPSLSGLLPKPGAWMNYLRGFMALPMYGTVIWLLGVLGAQAGRQAMIKVMWCLLCVVLALKLTKFISIKNFRLNIVMMIVIVCLPVALMIKDLHQSAHGVNFEKIAFNREAIDSYVRSGRSVMVVVTADWCITCKMNEKFILQSVPVRNAFVKKDVVYMEADWTNNDDGITEYIRGFKKAGVPLYVMYSGRNGHVEVLPTLLSRNSVIAGLNK